MPTRGSKHALVRILAIVLVTTLGAAACGDDGGTSSVSSAEASGTGGTDAGPSTGEKVTIGYSAWPGWFVWAVADKKGIFEAQGLDVELKYFENYTQSLDAMAAGQLDANSQTLNDTLVGVSSGSKQTAVVVNDNSAGNDAIIVDQSINSIADLKGKSIAVEAVVVDQFLLEQGLVDNGLSLADVEIKDLPTDQAAAAFAAGQADACAVFAPFTATALAKPGSKVLFDSGDYPGTIPDFLVVSQDMIAKRGGDVQKLVDSWYATLEFVQANPDEANQVMAEQAGQTVDAYVAQAGGTKIFTAAEALASLTGTGDRDLPTMAETVASFLTDTGLTPDKPSTEGLLDPSFTKRYVDTH